MQRIFKYELDVTDRQAIQMPTGAQILCVQIQGNVPCLWAKVNDEMAPVPREISIYGTGHALRSYPGDYIGTFQMAQGALVFHAYDRGSV